MGSVTYTGTKDSGGSFSKKFIIPDADLDRMLAWTQTAYAQPVGGQPGPPLNPAQGFAAWATDMMNRTIDAELHMKNKQSVEALPPNTPINAT